jgi:hypothetical protein
VANSDEIKELIDNVKEIKQFLLGDEFHPNGVRQRLDRVEECVRKQKNTNWVIGSIITIGTTVLLFIDKIKALFT